jgi:hypothetical protein
MSRSPGGCRRADTARFMLARAIWAREFEGADPRNLGFESMSAVPIASPGSYYGGQITGGGKARRQRGAAPKSITALTRS